MWQISKEASKKCETEIFDYGRCIWINRRYMKIEWDYDNWAQIFDKCDTEKQKLMPNTEF